VHLRAGRGRADDRLRDAFPAQLNRAICLHGFNSGLIRPRLTFVHGTQPSSVGPVIGIFRPWRVRQGLVFLELLPVKWTIKVAIHHMDWRGCMYGKALLVVLAMFSVSSAYA